MKPEYYIEFKRLKDSSQRDEAKVSLDVFLASFQTWEEKEAWVRWFFENEKTGHKIRHEIYEQLIFPVLLAEYKNLDAWATFQLAETAQNIYSAPSMHATLDNKSERQLMREAFELEPNEVARKRLLAIEIDWFNYCQHEWPLGILYGNDAASVDECDEIIAQISYARSLDIQHAHTDFFLNFEAKVENYKARLTARISSQQE